VRKNCTPGSVRGAARKGGSYRGEGQRGRAAGWPQFSYNELVMSELDRLKEQIAYLKYWQGVMVVTDISLVGWLITAGDGASLHAFALAIVGVVALTLGIIGLHRQIERRIDRIGSL